MSGTSASPAASPTSTSALSSSSWSYIAGMLAAMSNPYSAGAAGTSTQATEAASGRGAGDWLMIISGGIIILIGIIALSLMSEHVANAVETTKSVAKTAALVAA